MYYHQYWLENSGARQCDNSSAVMIVFKYLILRYFLCLDKRYWQIQNTTNCVIGLFSMCCMIIIVGFPASSEIATHTAVAALYFVTILIYTCFDCYLNYRVVCTNSQVNRGMKRAQVYKMFLCATELLFCFLSCSADLILYHLAQYYWERYHWKKPALKRPGDKGFWLMLTACATEWMILISLALYFLLYSVDFSSFHIVMEGVPAAADFNSIRILHPEINMIVDDAASGAANESKSTEQPV
ncbi:hypothetical protein HNY73_012762 [Argiope bruennichi]|uniref:CWH43-like N-terminal domain-containing protein n=1 Tax=Argiope bruennichi TaxID=94029 RepID=A0A8T0EXL7_ARGBR|nr:hypothetical protein HNY73_012762 [Argiope bruennichi]